MVQESRKMNFDQLLTEHVGEIGPYQIWILIILASLSTAGSLVNVNIVFLAAVPEHHCYIPELWNSTLNLTIDKIRNLSVPFDLENGGYQKCYMYNRDYTSLSLSAVEGWDVNGSDVGLMPCKQWYYDKSRYSTTIVSQWDLVCDKKWMVAFVQSIFLAGAFVGAILSGQVSDRFGRKYTTIAAMILTLTSSIGLAFSPNFIVFAVLRFCLGIFSVAAFTVGFVFNMEVVGPSWRNTAGLSVQYAWASGYIIIAAVAYFIRDWSTLQLVLCIPIAVQCILVFFIPESPRWLYATDKPKRAQAVVKAFAKSNKRELPGKLLDNMNLSEEKNDKRSGESNILSLFRGPRLRKRTLAMCYAWFVCSFVYYGLSLSSSSLGGDPFINFLISGGIEIPACLFTHICFWKVGRRYPLSFVFFFGGVALFCLLAIPRNMTTVTIVVSMSAKFLISAGFGMVYNYGAEVFPTQIRNLGVGTSSTCSRIGGIIAPYVSLLGTYSRFAPSISFGLVSLLGGFIVLLLPETRDRPLPETLEDAERFSKFKPKRNDLNEEKGVAMVPLRSSEYASSYDDDDKI